MSFCFHLSQPAAALRPCNQTLPQRAGTCRREVDTFVRLKRTRTQTTTLRNDTAGPVCLFY